MERKTLFIDVVLPLSIPNLYSYRVPHELNAFIKVGQRVVVQFGKSKLLTALVRNVHENVPAYQTKYLDFILDEHPIVTEDQFALWEWMASYYMAHLGEVMIAALPSSFKLASETKVLLNENAPDSQAELSKLSDSEIVLIDALEIRGVLDLSEIGEVIDRKTVYPIVKRLIDKGFLVTEEELKEVYKPKIEKYIELHPSIENEVDMKRTFETLGRSVKQQELLLLFLQQSNFHEERSPVKKTALLEASSSSYGVLKALLEKGILVEKQSEVGRLNHSIIALSNKKQLSDFQNNALDKIKNVFTDKQACLLHGITGSGKTEVYVELIQAEIDKGNKVLYLLPEIALTTQIISRLRQYFGSRIGVYHSKFSANERVEIWNDILYGRFNKYDIILGARSAVFLPFKKLGLIIVDEEHETSFKQHDPSPRYNARDAAYFLGKQHQAKVLLGSATPSIEVMSSAQNTTIGYVVMNQRFGGIPLPEILCIDLKQEKKRKKMAGIFSQELLETTKAVLAKGEQVIFFQNRRGYAPRWVCEQCYYTPQCTQCDVSLTYHKYQHRLNCHYCGYNTPPPTSCVACGVSDLKMIGIGTEKIEEEIALHLGPEVRVQRMDLDTTRSKHAYQHIIDDFEDHKIDILVGTQMVTKGLDFDKVSLVAVLNVDDLLFYPDFRAFERAYQLLTQVSGRAGRKNKRGKVLLQTHDPNHWVIQRVVANDYMGMYTHELEERKNYNYPPYFRMIRITIRHKKEDVTDKASDLLTEALKEKLGNRVLGPEYSSIKRIRNLYNKMITVKFERDASAKGVKDLIRAKLAMLAQHTDFKPVRVKIDVDPL